MSAKLTTKQAAEYLGVGTQYVYMLLNTGRILGRKDGRRLYFYEADLKRYADSRGNTEAVQLPVTAQKRCPGLAESQPSRRPPLLPHLQTKGIGGNGINQ